MSCLPCGKVTQKEQIVVKYYKTLFEKTGKIYYAYRLSNNSSFNFIEQQYFNDVFNKEIKPNLANGAEYYSIQEFRGN